MVRKCRDASADVSYLLGDIPSASPCLDLLAVYTEAADQPPPYQPSTPPHIQPPPKPPPPAAATVWQLTTHHTTPTPNFSPLTWSACTATTPSLAASIWNLSLADRPFGPTCPTSICPPAATTWKLPSAPDATPVEQQHEVSAIWDEKLKSVPCGICKSAHDEATMNVCDKCNGCFHPDCIISKGWTQPSRGPWYCFTCRGVIIMYGYTDVTQDLGLLQYLF